MRGPENFSIRETSAWYLLFTKPRQEWRARDNLIRQGYSVFLPTLLEEKIRTGERVQVEEPLFPRYLFIKLDDVTSNWLPIRSTLGVANLVRFGDNYCRAPNALVDGLMQVERLQCNYLSPGDQVRVASGPFAGLEGVYQQADGTRRVLVLMNLFSKPQTISMPVADIKRILA